MKVIPMLRAAALAIAGLASLPAAAQSDKPLATAETNTDGVVTEVVESVRKDGVLTVKVRFRNKTDKPVKLMVVHSGRYDDSYISAGDTKYTIIRDDKK